MKNIIWIIVDSVRNYTCPADRVDDRGRIELMDSLAETWVDFRNVVTSAPSTVMSIGAMFTSCPAYYLGANFVDLRLSECGLPSIGSVLGKQGYKTYCITLGPYEREGFGGIIDILPRSLWPTGARHRFEWNNYQINEALDNLLEKGVDEPFFLFVHYNCRGDNKISRNVESGLENLKKAGLLDDSVCFLTSDHGYPDPIRKKEVERLRKEAGLKNEIAHDLVMTEDNILVPLLVNFPGATPKTIETQICTLDYMPTALDLAGVALPKDTFGVSLKPLIFGSEMPDLSTRYTRVDGRFLAQSGRVTAIRRNDYKYMYFYDRDPSSREEFYCLKEDPLEVDNLFDNGKVVAPEINKKLKKFRNDFKLDQKLAEDFHSKFLQRKYFIQMERLGIDIKSVESVTYIRSGVSEFDRIFEKIILESNGSIIRLKTYMRTESQLISKSEDDLIIAALPSKIGNRILFANISKNDAKIKLISDFNLNISKLTPFLILTLLRSFWLKRKYYMEEPMYLIADLKATLKNKAGKPVKKFSKKNNLMLLAFIFR